MLAAKHKHQHHQGSKRGGDAWVNIGEQAHSLDPEIDGGYEDESEEEEGSGPGSGYGTSTPCVDGFANTCTVPLTPVTSKPFRM